MIVEYKDKNGNSYWTTKEEIDSLRKFEEERNKALSDFIFLNVDLPKVEERYEDSVKLAIVDINGNQNMVGRSNIDERCFELRDDCPSVKLPLVEIDKEKVIFKRWATGFDV